MVIIIIIFLFMLVFLYSCLKVSSECSREEEEYEQTRNVQRVIKRG